MTDIGINLAGVTYWATQEPFIDHFKTAGTWTAKNAAGTDATSTLTLNDLGYVTNLSSVAKLSISVGVDPISAPTTDEYVLTFTGTAKVTIANAKIVSQTNGKVVFDYTGGDSKPDVFITFSGFNSSSPLGDLHLVRADQVNLFNAGEIFNPAFVDKVSEWSVVRFMDWGDTNDSNVVSWATRTTTSDMSWSRLGNQDGAPLEVMVKLANEAHVDMWYNMPTKADDTYVRNALTYIHDHLDPTLKVHVEYSNEVWNSGFDAYSYAQTQANALWGNGGTVDHGANVFYGYRSAQVASIAHQVFGADAATRLVDVLAGQAANGALLTSYILPGVAKAGLGSASTLFEDYAIAPYFGQEMGTGVKAADEPTILAWAQSGAAGMDAAFKELEFGGTLTGSGSLATISGWLTKSAAAAKAAGLDLVTYEAGISLGTTRWATAEKPIIQDFFDRLMADPRMGQLYTKLVADFAAKGGTEFVAFNDVAVASDSGSYGVLGSIYDDSSPRYDALIAAAGGSGGGNVVTAASSSQMAAPSGHIVGTSGNDTLNASAADDTVEGGDGNDLINGSSSSTDASGHLIEADIYMGGAGSDTIVGGAGNDHIYGNAQTAVAGSVDGADSISGGAGNDYVQANAGADTVDGGSGNDRLYGGADNDSLLGGTGNDYLQGNKGLDTISGGDGSDNIHGGADADRLNGDAGNDLVYGDAGNDTVTGGAGIDTLAGGAGNDVFVFSGHDAAFATSGASAYLVDEITDFADGLDKILLDFRAAQVLQGSAASASAAATLADQLLHGHVGQADVAAVTVGSDTYMFWDSTGHGGALDSAVKVDHVLATAFTTADFV